MSSSAPLQPPEPRPIAAAQQVDEPRRAFARRLPLIAFLFVTVQIGLVAATWLAFSAAWSDSLRAVFALTTAGSVLLLAIGGWIAWVSLRQTDSWQRALTASEERYRVLAQASAVGIWHVAGDGSTIYRNPAMNRLLGTGAEETGEGESYHRYFTPESLARIAEEEAKRPLGVASTYEAELIGADGVSHHVLLSGAPIVDPEGRLTSIGTCVDITDRKRAEEALQASEARLRLLVEQMPAVLWTVDEDERFSSSLGLGLPALIGSGEKALGQPIGRFFTGDHGEEAIRAHRKALAGEAVNFDFENGARFFRCHVRPLTVEGERIGLIGAALDLSDRRIMESRLAHLADHDPLTDLLNRRRFQEEVSELLTREDGPVPLAMLWLDLDQFKEINDGLGHHAGDDMLREVAHLLRGELRTGDVLARLGGDEFAVLLPLAGRDQAVSVAQRILIAFESTVRVISGRPVRVATSIGVVLSPEHGTTSVELLANADIAMYEAKSAGGNRFVLFEHPDGKARPGRYGTWTERLRHALQDEELVLYAQPIVDLERGKIARWELLLRLQEEDGRLITPDAFLPSAERTDVIHEIDRWVVHQAIGLLAGGDGFSLEVNISGRAFGDNGMLTLIERELAAAGVAPERLILEVTESAAVSDIFQARQFLATLRSLGCGFAIDDFGISFSSFYYLKHLPVDYVKIDGSFIRDVGKGPQDEALVRAIVEVARTVGIRTIAEHVEDVDTAVWLRDHGVDYAQGHYIGPPRPVGPGREGLERPISDFLPLRRRGGGGSNSSGS